MLTAFVIASLVLAVTPGPGVLFIVARALALGPRHALVSVAGVAAGNLANAVAAALGLAAVLAASSLAFQVLKWAGVAYLVWLGLAALRSTPAARVDDVAEPGRSTFREAFVVALLNPKTTLFFAAFLPQFTDPARPLLGQALALGALFVLIAALTDSVYALAAARLQPWLRSIGRSGGVARWSSATVYFVLALLAAHAENRRS